MRFHYRSIIIHLPLNSRRCQLRWASGSGIVVAFFYIEDRVCLDQKCTNVIRMVRESERVQSRNGEREEEEGGKGNVAGVVVVVEATEALH